MRSEKVAAAGMTVTLVVQGMRVGRGVRRNAVRILDW